MAAAATTAAAVDSSQKTAMLGILHIIQKAMQSES